uniref:Uncharacterized protein n=1 Tax=Acrobeloides nanus TaxID=290746 RepID=A0A914D5N4_9BILA
MALKSRILLKSIETTPAVADTVVQAICVLYNFDIDECRQYRPEQLADHGDENNGAWRNAAGGAVQRFVQMRPANANNSKKRGQMHSKFIENLFLWCWSHYMARTINSAL